MASGDLEVAHDNVRRQRPQPASDHDIGAAEGAGVMLGMAESEHGLELRLHTSLFEDLAFRSFAKRFTKVDQACGELPAGVLRGRAGEDYVWEGSLGFAKYNVKMHPVF